MVLETNGLNCAFSLGSPYTRGTLRGIVYRDTKLL